MKKSKLLRVAVKIILPLVVFIFIYSYSPYKLEFLGHYHKIWAHSTNSIEKLNSALNYYKGVELDLYYNAKEDFFDISHLQHESINLNLENYINTLQNVNQIDGIWLDIKNLNNENAERILGKLLNILDKKKIPHQKVIIESRNPEALPVFTKNNFISSYYLPPFLYKENQDVLKVKISKINKILSEQPRIAISSSYKDYEIMAKYFPNKPKYIWALVLPINIDFLLTKKILRDEKVKVVLVHYKAIKGNR